MDTKTEDPDTILETPGNAVVVPKSNAKDTESTTLASEAYTLLHCYKALMMDTTDGKPISHSDVFKNTVKAIELRIEEIKLLLKSRVDALKKP